MQLKLENHDLKSLYFFQDKNTFKEKRNKFNINISKEQNNIYYHIFFLESYYDFFKQLLIKYDINNFQVLNYSETKLICNKENMDKLINVLNEMQKEDIKIYEKNLIIQENNKKIYNDLIKNIYSLGFSPWKNTNKQFLFPEELKQQALNKFSYTLAEINNRRKEIYNVIIEGYNLSLNSLNDEINIENSTKDTPLSLESNYYYFKKLDEDKYFQLGLAYYLFQYEGESFKKVKNILNSYFFENKIEDNLEKIELGEIDPKLSRIVYHYTEILSYSKNNELIKEYFKQILNI